MAKWSGASVPTVLAWIMPKNIGPSSPDKVTVAELDTGSISSTKALGLKGLFVVIQGLGA